MSDDPLHVSGLDVTLGGSRILTDVNLHVGTGEFVALLGANGSGKSTLVRAIVGAVPIAAGEIQLFGADASQRRSVPWPRLGYVPQRSTATTGVPATVAEVVGSGLLSGLGLRRAPDARQRVRDALDQVGLATRAGSAVAHLSGGQQQRVLIARALVRNPDLLVLDEPLAGVDAGSQQAFAQTMAAVKAAGKSVLVVLHETAPLADLITRAVVLRHGRVVHDGAPPLPAPGHEGTDHYHLHAHTADLPDGAEAPGARPNALRIQPGGLP